MTDEQARIADDEFPAIEQEATIGIGGDGDGDVGGVVVEISCDCHVFRDPFWTRVEFILQEVLGNGIAVRYRLHT